MVEVERGGETPVRGMSGKTQGSTGKELIGWRTLGTGSG